MIKKFEGFTYNEKIFDLQDRFQKEIVGENKVINGFHCSFEMSGSIYWAGDDYMFYATPYWEDFTDKSGVEILDNDGNQIDYFEKYLGELTSEEFPKLKQKYFDFVDRLTKRLIERNNKCEKLIKMYDNIPEVELKDKLGDYDGDDMKSFHELDLDEFENVYNEIINKYPELISISDFNL